MITFVLISCGRLDLLKKTVDSFLKFNTYPITEFILVDDSGDTDIHDSIRAMYPDWTLVFESHRGQIVCIDDAYSRVKTPYIFHCEDDWEFIRGGFIEPSLEVLKYNNWIMQVAICNTHNHPVIPDVYNSNGVDFRMVDDTPDNRWHGFSFNPALRNIAHWNKVGPFMDIGDYEPTGIKEAVIGEALYQFGYRVAILNDSYCNHTGYGRHKM